MSIPSIRDAGRSRVAIVDEAMARHYFGQENPIGRLVNVDADPRTGGWFGNDKPYEIVGLVGSVKRNDLRGQASPSIYFNMFGENRLVDEFELRTTVDPASVSDQVRRLMRNVVSGVPVSRVTTLAEQVDSNIVPEHLMATLSEYFGGLGAALAGIGLYGLLAYTVSQRTAEIGIRMALGSTAGKVIYLVLMDALRMVFAGLIGGALLVLWGRPFAASLVQDLNLRSVVPFEFGVGAIVVVALLATYLPARRAASVDLTLALRHE